MLIDNSGTILQDVEVTALLDGGFAVAYTSNGWGAADTDISLRIYNADGTPRIGPLRVNTAIAGDQNSPTITAIGNGYIVVGWDDGNHAYYQAYAPNGDAIGTNFEVATGVTAMDIAVVIDGMVANAVQSSIQDNGGDPTGSSIWSSVFQLVRTTIGDGTGETLTGDLLRDVMNGNGGTDTLNGAAGNDALDGGEGNDTLIGGAGDDTLAGGNGSDRVDYSAETSAVIIDLAANVAVAVGGRDTLTSIEEAVGGSGNDAVAGTTAVNYLDGGGGIDTISYYRISTAVVLDLAAGVGVDGSSRDTILNFENANGGAGNDAFSSTAGVNGFDGLGGIDTISYYTSAVSVSVDLVNNMSTQNGVVDRLFNFENVNGSLVNDTIVGNGGSNVLNGLRGSDTLTGAGGNDTFVFRSGEAVGDTVTDFAGNGAGAGDALRFTGFGTLAQGATFTFVSGNTWRIHSGLDSHNETISINGGAGAVHPTDFVFA